MPCINLFQFDLFKIIGGTDGTSDGEKVLLEIFPYLIDSKFISNITWSGKTNSKEKKKTRFDHRVDIVGLIYEICTTADSKYSNVRCKTDMVYKVFKYAYRNKVGENSNCTNQKASSSTIGNISTAPTNKLIQPLQTNTPAALVPVTSAPAAPARQPLQALPQQHFHPIPHEFPSNSNFHQPTAQQPAAHQISTTQSQHFYPIPQDYLPMNPHLPYNNFQPPPNGNYQPPPLPHGNYPPPPNANHPPMQNNNNGWY